MYRLTSDTSIFRLTDAALIPADPGNADYAAYLAWLGEGNTPEPAPEYAPPVPQVVSPFQARAALLGAGLLDQVDAMMADPATPRESKLAWEYGTEVRRNSPLTSGMGVALGLDDAALDNLFIMAAGITA